MFHGGGHLSVPEPSETYQGLRRMVLDLKAEQFSGHVGEHPVYAALVDMNMRGGCASIACVVDGTAGLYTSPGGGLIGAGQRYESVRSAALAFLDGSAQVLNRLTLAKDFSLPSGGKHHVYLLSKEGIFKDELDPDAVSSCSKETQFLFYLYQNVITALRENAEDRFP